jgi:hypothetical protein
MPVKAMKTMAQKPNIARDDLFGCGGNSITGKNNPFIARQQQNLTG